MFTPHSHEYRSSVPIRNVDIYLQEIWRYTPHLQRRKTYLNFSLQVSSCHMSQYELTEDL